MDESSSHAASSSENDTSDGHNGKDMPQAGEVDNVTESIANGSTEPLSNAETHSEMDAVLEEESERLDKVMLKSKEAHKDDYKPQEIDKNHQYKKLIELLTKSQFYTEFLVKKLEADPLKRNSPKKGRKRDDKSDQPSPRKGNQKDTQRVMEIAADVIANKKSGEEEVEEGPAAENADSGRTKTLESGLVVPLGQPKLLEGACLRDYQMEGLNWLRLLFENGVNGILADEMGLGKTIQVIALICHLVEKNVRGPFLVIGPLSTLPNWAIEFERFAPQIPFILYHGNEESRIALRKKMSQKKVVKGHKVYPVIITSYDYPLRDAKFLNKTSWRYIIIDEGHRLKNHNSLLSRALRQYTSANRLLLTGTPLHNSLSELWALLNFLVPEIFDNLEIFESWFRIEDLSDDNASEKVLEEEKKSQILSTMHKILSPFMLRRVKSEVKLNLPSKKELVVYAPMSSIQIDLYRAVLDYNYAKLKAMDEFQETQAEEDGSRPKRSCTQTKKYYVLEDLFQDEDALLESSGSIIDNKTLIVEDKENPKYAIRVKMQNASMMLRKIVNHPYLIQYPLEEGTEYARIDEDLVKASGKLQVLDAMLTKLKEKGHKVLLFSTFTSLIEILEDYLSLRSFSYVRLDGNTKLDDRQSYIKQFNNDPDMFLFLISTRAGGLGINLAAADTVIIFDSDWNPQVDLQAQDRCHRIGQTRPVVVYRFVTAGTVDERIFVRAAAKRKLEKIIIHKGNYSALKPKDEHSIDLVELRKLLNSRDHQQVIYPNGYVFSDKELDELLDRSDLIDGTVDNMSGSKVEERSFKEYYGYTGTKKVVSDEEISSNVQIVDQDSNDAPCEVTPVKRSPMKKNGSSGIVSVQKHDSELNDLSETKDTDKSAQQNKHTTSEGSDESDCELQSAKRIKLQDEAEVDTSSTESSKSSSSRATRASKKK